ncbi:phosphate system positive regulatory protein pho81 [Phlyctochytrium planicorne]|nr:phosphate system positive regulatory protein pho81 [Phlyctochytrium planicorne]
MKFGKYIQEQQSDWGGAYYLNYKALKKIIGSVEGEPGFSGPTVVDSSHDELQAVKTAFFFKLERELEKINAFYLQKEAEFKVRLRSLIDKRRMILSKTNSRSQSSLHQLKEALSLFQHDLTKLQSFVEVNATGFRKILKKWDKRAKSSTKELYLSRQIEIQPCFNNDVLAELTDAATTHLAELDAILDNPDALSTFQEIPDSSATGGNAFAGFGIKSAAIITNTEDSVLDLENDLVSLFHDNRTPEIHEFLEKRKNAMKDEDGLLSRVFLRICTEVSVELLTLLLATKTVDVNLSDDINSRTAVHEAAIHGKLDVIRLLLDNGATITSTDMYGRTPLHYSAMYGRYDCTVFLISSGAKVDAVDLDDCSPLIQAVIGGHTECVEALLSRQTDPKANSGPDPLVLACEHGHRDIATLLLQKGSRVAINSVQGGLSALHVTAREGHAELCSLLIQNGADFDFRDSFTGWTPIFYSASEGHIECVKVLIAAGCSIDLKDETDWLPWTYALYRGHIEVARLLEVEVALISPQHARTLADLPPLAESAIQPMAPSALFVDDMEMDGLNIDSIPSLSLPPPIIPFRIYGHNYLEKKSFLQLNFNGISNSSNSAENNPIKLFGSRQLSSLKLLISSKPDLGIPYSVILPLKDDSEVYTFLIDHAEDGVSLVEDFSLQFDIFPTFGTKVLGRAVVLASQLTLALNRRTAGAADNEVVNNTKSHSESGIRSFVTASSLVEEYLNVEVQLSRDLKPIVYGSWFISPLDSLPSSSSGSPQSSFPETSSSPLQIPAASFKVSPFDITHLESLGLFNAFNGKPSSSYTVYPAEAFRGLGFKTDDLANVISENIFSLEDVLTALPHSIGLCIDIKYPTAFERDSLHLQNHSDVNTYVDLILKTIYDHGSNRSFIFSSFNPSICTALSWKQPNYGVFFKTRCGYDRTCDYSVGSTKEARFPGLTVASGEQDKRCTSIKEAVRFAKKSNFLGIICEATPLIKVPALINTIKESGLILATFGKANEEANNVFVQESAGVDAILSHGVLRYNSS